jgi:hypothetical protein
MAGANSSKKSGSMVFERVDAEAVEVRGFDPVLEDADEGLPHLRQLGAQVLEAPGEVPVHLLLAHVLEADATGTAGLGRTGLARRAALLADERVEPRVVQVALGLPDRDPALAVVPRRVRELGRRWAACG